MDQASQLTSKLQKELNSGVTALILLATLERSGKAMYGYEILKHLRELSNDRLPMHQGAVYPVLRALESHRLLTSAIGSSTAGPPRKYYSITAKGRRTLAKWIEAWDATSGLVETALEGRSWQKRKKNT
jgi:PadR family transcriptional regulator PadR